MFLENVISLIPRVRENTLTNNCHEYNVGHVAKTKKVLTDLSELGKKELIWRAKMAKNQLVSMRSVLKDKKHFLKFRGLDSSENLQTICCNIDFFFRKFFIRLQYTIFRYNHYNHVNPFCLCHSCSLRISRFSSEKLAPEYATGSWRRRINQSNT